MAVPLGSLGQSYISEVNISGTRKHPEVVRAE